MVSLADWAEVSNCFNSSSTVSYLSLPNSSSSEALTFNALVWGSLRLCLSSLPVLYNNNGQFVRRMTVLQVKNLAFLAPFSLSSENRGVNLLRTKICQCTLSGRECGCCWCVCCGWSTEIAYAIAKSAKMCKSGQAHENLIWTVN